MTLQIGSREHRREGLTGETWKGPVGDFTQRALYTQSVLAKLSNVLNSGQFITNDIGFSSSILFSRPERKGGKRAGGGPGQKNGNTRRNIHDLCAKSKLRMNCVALEPLSPKSKPPPGNIKV